MNSLKHFILLVAFSWPLQATDFNDEVGAYSDSGIFGPKYSTILEEISNLASTYPDVATQITYGSTVEKRPLTMLKIARKNTKTPANAKAVMIGGSMHGDEYLNIEDRLPRWFLEVGLTKPSIQTYLNQGGAIYLVPILNPDGYAARQRENARNQDLNRDFPIQIKKKAGFKQPETRQLVSMIENELTKENRKLIVAMDYHCCTGAILYPWSFKPTNIPDVNQARFDVIGRIFKGIFGKGYKFGKTPTVLGYSAVGTSKDFYYETFNALGFTFEGKRDVEDKNFNKHTLMWEQIFEAIVRGEL